MVNDRETRMDIKRLGDAKGTLVNAKTGKLLGSTGIGKDDIPTPNANATTLGKEAELDRVPAHSVGRIIDTGIIAKVQGLDPLYPLLTGVPANSVGRVIDTGIIAKVQGLDPLYPLLTGVHKFTEKPPTKSEQVKSKVNALVNSTKIQLTVVQAETLEDPKSFDRYFCDSCWIQQESTNFTNPTPPCATCILEYGIRLKNAEKKYAQALAFQEIANLPKSDPVNYEEEYNPSMMGSERGAWVYVDDIEVILDKYIK